LLHELADVVEQVFTIALTENLYPDACDRRAAIADYGAEHGLSCSAMRLGQLPLSASREVEARARVIKLMRIYAGRWRVFNSEGVQCRRRDNVNAQPRRVRKPAKDLRLERAPQLATDLHPRHPDTTNAAWDTGEDTRPQAN
jgi:hypothetical protein